MREIELTQRQVTLVDDKDYEELSKYKWHARLNGRVWYALHSRRENGKVHKILMHRLIMAAPQGLQVDHIDGDGLNNQRRNLRLVNSSQNQWNRTNKRRDTSSQFKGVTFHKSSGLWEARIRVYGIRRELGYFNDEVDAARAYNDAARELFGEFAALNLLQDPG